MADKRCNIPSHEMIPVINGRGPFTNVLLTDRHIMLIRDEGFDVEIVRDEPGTAEMAPAEVAPAEVAPAPVEVTTDEDGFPVVTIGDDKVKVTPEYVAGINTKAVGVNVAGALGVDLGIDVTKDDEIRGLKLAAIREAILAKITPAA